jgi:putative hydrolases of HD superfamily
MEQDLINFFLEVGKVKHMPQRGLVLRGIENPARIGGHSFREAFMGWVIGSEAQLNTTKVIKFALLHDLARGYAGDITPYDPILQNVQDKDYGAMYEKWVRLPKQKKEQFAKESEEKETQALLKLTKNLSKPIANEMTALWNEYAAHETKEAKFVYQLHILENFIQALEYWKEDKSFPIDSWWQQTKEQISNPFLVAFLQQLDNAFYNNSDPE